MNHHICRIASGAIAATIVAAPVGDAALDPPPRPPTAAFLPSSVASNETLQEQPLETELDAGPPPTPHVVSKKEQEPKPKKQHRFRRVRTPRDEDLPAWMPISARSCSPTQGGWGCLTVVESCDLAENLGLAPMGTALDGGCPSVAELLEKERLERLANGANGR